MVKWGIYFHGSHISNEKVYNSFRKSGFILFRSFIFKEKVSYRFTFVFFACFWQAYFLIIWVLPVNHLWCIFDSVLNMLLIYISLVTSSANFLIASSQKLPICLNIYLLIIRTSHETCSIKKVFLNWWLATLLKHDCFPMNFATFLRKAFS